MGATRRAGVRLKAVAGPLAGVLAPIRPVEPALRRSRPAHARAKVGQKEGPLAPSRAQVPHERVDPALKDVEMPDRRVDLPDRDLGEADRRVDPPHRRFGEAERHVDPPDRRLDEADQRVDPADRRVGRPPRRDGVPLRRRSEPLSRPRPAEKPPRSPPKLLSAPSRRPSCPRIGRSEPQVVHFMDAKARPVAVEAAMSARLEPSRRREVPNRPMSVLAGGLRGAGPGVAAARPLARTGASLGRRRGGASRPPILAAPGRDPAGVDAARRRPAAARAFRVDAEVRRRRRPRARPGRGVRGGSCVRRGARRHLPPARPRLGVGVEGPKALAAALGVVAGRGGSARQADLCAEIRRRPAPPPRNARPHRRERRRTRPPRGRPRPAAMCAPKSEHRPHASRPQPATGAARGCRVRCGNRAAHFEPPDSYHTLRPRGATGIRQRGENRVWRPAVARNRREGCNATEGSWPLFK